MTTRAFASLHTALPTAQNEHEVNYKGYHRIPVEFSPEFGNVPTTILFPEILKSQEGEITHIAIGLNPAGKGDVLLTIHSMPYIKLTKTVDGHAPRIIVTNIAPDALPANINTFALLMIKLMAAGEMAAEDLHPAIYEALNLELERVGMPIIKVIRTGAANMSSTTGWGLEDLIGDAVH